MLTVTNRIKSISLSRLSMHPDVATVNVLALESDSFWLYFAKYAERRQIDGYAGYGEWTRKFVTGDIRRAKFLGVI